MRMSSCHGFGCKVHLTEGSNHIHLHKTIDRSSLLIHTYLVLELQEATPHPDDSLHLLGPTIDSQGSKPSAGILAQPQYNVVNTNHELDPLHLLHILR